MTSTELAPVDRSKLVVARAIADEDVETLFSLRAMASAAELARTRIGAQEAANEAGEIKVRAERGLALLDVAAAPHGGSKSSSAPPELERVSPLAGMHHDTRAAIRKLAKLDDAEFERRIEDARNDENAGVSTTRILARDRNQSVTYKNQPGIDATSGTVPLEGTSHLYRVHKLLWPEQVEEVLEGLLVPASLHVCCGHSQLGDFRVDSDAEQNPDLVADAADLPLDDNSYATVLCDPPYNGQHQWNHDMLSELARVASHRIVFQHWFIPANPDGRYKKAQDKFALSQIMVWQPKTYFGRAQIVSVFDAV